MPQLIGLVGRVFTNGREDLGFKDFKNGTWYLLAEHSAIQGIGGKVEQSRERSSGLPFTSVL